MSFIKNKKDLMSIIDNFLLDYRDYDLPKFSEVAPKSLFFNKNYLKFVKGNENIKYTREFIDLIFYSYFSSTSVRKKINLINKDMKKLKPNLIKNYFSKNKKKIYIK